MDDGIQATSKRPSHSVRKKNKRTEENRENPGGINVGDLVLPEQSGQFARRHVHSVEPYFEAGTHEVIVETADECFIIATRTRKEEFCAHDTGNLANLKLTTRFSRAASGGLTALVN